MSHLTPPQETTLDVAGAAIRARRYPAAQPSRTGLLLVHGGAAHQGWWDRTARTLQERHDVVTLDLSGHGDSGRRERYDFPDWAAESLAVARELLDHPPVAVGHSMGGMVIAHAAAADPTAFRGLVAIDTPLRPRGRELLERRRRTAAAGPRRYPDLATAVASFSPKPPPTPAAEAFVHEIAQQSFHRVGSEWVQKLDPRVFLRSEVDVNLLYDVTLPLRWFRADQALIDEAHRAELARAMEPHGQVVDVPDAGHHVLLDNPQGTAWLVSIAAEHLLPADRSQGHLPPQARGPLPPRVSGHASR